MINNVRECFFTAKIVIISINDKISLSKSSFGGRYKKIHLIVPIYSVMLSLFI